MPKNIVICADGTGNTTVQGRGTNVFKLYEAVDENGHRFDATKIQQVAIYHDGVGTENLKWLRLFSGAFGWGLSRNVKQLYGELARVYDPGDHIFLFGFSRGAFTVRTLAGLVINCGILDPGRYPTNRAFWRAVRQAYGEYRRKYQTVISKAMVGEVKLDPAALRERFSVAIPAFTDPNHRIIDFIGVWDTVDAVGAPFGLSDLINGVVYRFKFPDLTLSSQVGQACHALALDEERQSFCPLLWKESPSDAARIDQVWFPGVHSNVGGGYPRQGISLVALDWMMAKAEHHGLRFLPLQRQAYRDSTDGDDKLYDPRSGFGVFYRCRPRNVSALCRANGIATKVHRTVYQRIARNIDGYAPGSVPPGAQVITASPAESVESLGQLVADYFGSDTPLLVRERRARACGVLAYWLLIGSVLGLGAYMIATYVNDFRAIHDWRALLVLVATTIVSTNWLGVAARTAWHHLWLVSVALVALFVNLRVDHRLDDRYSEFWHGLRAPMRDLLERR